MWYLHKDRHIAQWNREAINTHTWSNDFQHECQNHSMGKGQSFQQMVLRKQDTTCKTKQKKVGSLPDNHIQKLTQN